jgi:hypothetical protein
MMQEEGLTIINLHSRIIAENVAQEGCLVILAQRAFEQAA